jgi:hypothetical protein
VAGLAVPTARNREMQRHGEERQAGMGEKPAAPAEARGERMADRPEDGRGEAAQQGDLRHGAPGALAADPGQGEGRVVEGEPHGDAEAQPGGVVGGRLVREAEADATHGREAGARHHDRSPAMPVDQLSRQRRRQAHDQKGRREPAWTRDRLQPRSAAIGSPNAPIR